MQKRYGFFGGAFNPPTIAHIELAKKALIEGKLDKLYFVPVGETYQKEGLIDSTHRFNMLKLLSDDKIDVLDIELKVNKKIYAIDAFEMINEKFKNSDNFFIMGADNYKKIHTWKSSDKLLKNYKYIVIERNNEKLENLNKKNIFISNSEMQNISSTEIRNKIKNGYDVKKLLTDKVYNYITTNQLY